MYGDEGPGKDRSWLNVRPGLAIEVEYDSADYRMAQPEDEVDAKLTGRVRVTREVLFAADFLTNSLTGEED